jgi:hypothetical protein
VTRVCIAQSRSLRLFVIEELRCCRLPGPYVTRRKMQYLVEREAVCKRGILNDGAVVIIVA